MLKHTHARKVHISLLDPDTLFYFYSQVDTLGFLYSEPAVQHFQTVIMHFMRLLCKDHPVPKEAVAVAHSAVSVVLQHHT